MNYEEILDMLKKKGIYRGEYEGYQIAIYDNFGRNMSKYSVILEDSAHVIDKSRYSESIDDVENLIKELITISHKREVKINGKRKTCGKGTVG